jgi:hypothetical protein
MEQLYKIINTIQNLSIFSNKNEHEFKKPDSYKNINSSSSAKQ